MNKKVCRSPAGFSLFINLSIAIELEERDNEMINPQHPLRVRCADNNVFVLDMLAKTLQSAGHLVEVATDGRAAVTRVERDPSYFQLIVTDTRMPRLDGFGVVE